MNQRARELSDLGLRTFGVESLVDSRDEALIKAIAVMLAAPSPKKKAKPEDKLPFSPQALHKAMELRAGNLVVCRPVDGRVFGRLGKTLQSISGLEYEDMDKLVGWIEAGALRFWKGVPTFEHVVNNISKWIPLAREWDRRGRQTLRGSNVGKDTPQGDAGGMFK